MDLELAQPMDTCPGYKMIVSVLDPAQGERDEWLSLSLGTIASAYGDSEPEYTVGMIKEPNRSIESEERRCHPHSDSAS